MIFSRFKGSQAEYCDRVGFKTSNLSLILSGVKSMGLDVFNRLLSGIGYEAVCLTTIHLVPKQTGQSVPDAPFVPLEEGLCSEDQDLFNLEQ